MPASYGRETQSGGSSFLQTASPSFWFSEWSPGLEVGELDSSTQSATSSPREENSHLSISRSTFPQMGRDQNNI